MRRQLLALIGLSIGTVVLFFVTRAAAEDARKLQTAASHDWYAVGQADLAKGDANGAIDAFRQAQTDDRSNRQYQLALGQALVAGGHDGDAQAVFEQVREGAPEDPQVNLQLARLAAREGDVTAAVRYYHSAIYGIWPDGADAARRRVRLELVQLLLSHGEHDAAVSELVALASVLPPDPAGHVQVGQLLLTAGEYRRAGDEFAKALALQPGDPDALRGAGEAAFRRGDYADAAQDLGQAVAAAPTPDARDLLAVTSGVLADDPLARGVDASARMQRAGQNLDTAVARLTACAAGAPADFDARAQAIQQEAAAMDKRLGARANRGDMQVIEEAVDLAGRVERLAVEHCGVGAPADRAIVLIADAHHAAGLP